MPLLIQTLLNALNFGLSQVTYALSGKHSTCSDGRVCQTTTNPTHCENSAFYIAKESFLLLASIFRVYDVSQYQLIK